VAYSEYRTSYTCSLPVVLAEMTVSSSEERKPSLITIDRRTMLSGLGPGPEPVQCLAAFSRLVSFSHITQKSPWW
jgi:hypothetical protein